MTFTMENPSPAYAKALDEAREHQRAKKTWTGGLMERHLERIKALIDRTEAQSALDYGCGKCLQYLRPAPDGGSVDDYLGIPVFKMDPAMVPDYRVPPEMTALLRGRPKPKIPSDLPEGTWDIVIVTHVLRTIPLVDLRDWVVPLLHERANKAIFVTENLDVPHKTPFSNVDDKPKGWTAAEWMELLELPGSDVEVEAWFRGTPGNDPRVSGFKDSTFRRWPFEA